MEQHVRNFKQGQKKSLTFASGPKHNKKNFTSRISEKKKRPSKRSVQMVEDKQIKGKRGSSQRLEFTSSAPANERRGKTIYFYLRTENRKKDISTSIIDLCRYLKRKEELEHRYSKGEVTFP